MDRIFLAVGVLFATLSGLSLMAMFVFFGLSPLVGDGIGRVGILGSMFLVLTVGIIFHWAMRFFGLFSLVLFLR
jgi:hypothetical protein